MSEQSQPTQAHSTTARGIALSTQLSVLLILLALLTFVASVWVSTSHMRTYLDTQLSRSALDTANSLGLSISPYLSEEQVDKITADTMISAIFDSGYYVSIEFVAPNNKVLFQRSNPIQVQGVPHWFVDWFALNPPVMSSEVNDGWRIAGVLKVQSHPGFAYVSLWEHTKDVFWTNLLLCVLALIAVHWLLFVVLKPLKDIEQQAALLAEKRFEFLNYMPMTKELRAVVQALNHMVGNVKRSFTELTDRAEQLNQQAYIDSLTGLPNRRALVQSFASLQAESDISGDQNYLALVSLPSLKEINDRSGYAAGDHYVEKASLLIQAQLASLQQSQLFRLSGSEFAVLAKLGKESAQNFINQTQQAFSIAQSEQYPQGFARIALLAVAPDADLSSSLAKIDHLQGLIQQDLKQPIDTPQDVVKSKADWQQLLQKFTRSVVNEPVTGSDSTELFVSPDMEKMFELEVQPVYQKDQLLYIETFVKFKADGQQISTVDVFAMAERLGLSTLLDKALVLFILQQIQNRTEKFAINISKSALHDVKFSRWLFALLKANQDKLPALVFEVNEQATLGATASAAAFFSALKAVGAQVTIERFGASFSSFRYLQGLNVDFIKIDGSYVRSLHETDTRFFVQTMTHICHGIGILVIAPHVENQQIADICHEIHIDAQQGRGLHPPVYFSAIVENSGCIFNKTGLD